MNPDDSLRLLVFSRRPSAGLALAEAWGPFDVTVVAEEGRLAGLLAGAEFDALLLDTQDLAGGSTEAVPLEQWVSRFAPDLAMVLVMPPLGAAAAIELLRLGVQDLLTPAQAAGGELGPRLRAAIERKAIEREARKAYATDLGTGLPHQQQLVEHMSHLLALREREPSPMALLALRIEGFETVESRYGREAANVLRRKVAVRLRAGVRASDVVASIGDDTFAVLLAALLSPSDARQVGDKMLVALQAPFKVTGHDVAVAAALGVARFPEDGVQPEALLRQALAMAGSADAAGRSGMSNFMESGLGLAANDED